MNTPMAFPSHAHTSQGPNETVVHQYLSEGMTLRDYFAAKALQGLLTDPSMRFGGDYDSLTAKMAYSLADAMLGVR